MHTRINLSYVTPLLPVRPFRALPLSTRVKPIVTLRSPTKRRVRTSPLAVIDKESQTSSSTLLDVPREAWTAEGRPLITHSTKHPPGKFPLALELDYVLNHPITEGIIALLVSLNCLAFALQTLDVGPQLHQAFRSYESNLTVLFLIEYVARWYGKGFSPKYLLTRGMILDFIAVSPLAFAVADQSEALFVRILRLSRILRIRSLFLDSERGQEIMESMSFAQIRLANVVLTLFSLLYVSAGLFYQVEKDVNPAVQNFFDAFYFSIITLFTVGFGDITPLTSAGKATTLLTVVLGAVLIPYQLSEVERVRKISTSTNKATSEIDAVQSATEDRYRFSDALFPPYDVGIECPKCYLRGHQVDARYCRNCASQLSGNLSNQ